METQKHWDFDDLIISATRYYIGRKTYAVSTHARRLAEAWPELPNHVRETIRRDLQREFERDERLREMKDGVDTGPLGWNTDRREWEKVREAWQAMESEAERRAGNPDGVMPPPCQALFDAVEEYLDLAYDANFKRGIPYSEIEDRRHEVKTALRKAYAEAGGDPPPRYNPATGEAYEEGEEVA